MMPRMISHAHLIILFCAILIVTMLVAATLGAVSISFTDLITGNLSPQDWAILTSIRLPRILLAGIVGCALAVSGAAMQGLFRNPLADPGLIGISSGAAFAVALVIVFAGSYLNILGLYGISLAAFTGGALTCLIVFYFAKITGTFSVTYMLLAGIAINAIAAAGIGFLTYLSNDDQLRMLTFWTMGSLGGALWPAVIVAITITLPATLILIKNANALNLLMLGESEAKYLGMDSERLKKIIILCTAMSVGVAVAVSGIIGFIGLVVPHLVRLTIGPDHRFLIPASGVIGALLLICADTIARLIVMPAEMPVGIITSLIGGPFFLWLLVTQYARRIET